LEYRASWETHFAKRRNLYEINTIIDPEIIYKDYIYVTTSSSGLQNHFKAYADEVCSQLQNHPS